MPARLAGRCQRGRRASSAGRQARAWRPGTRGVREAAPAGEAVLRAWLAERGLTGYALAHLVWQRFGYPEYKTASAGEPIDAQCADRPHLRPLIDGLCGSAAGWSGRRGPGARGVRHPVARRTFAVIGATTRTRVDLGLRLARRAPGGRWLRAPGGGLGAVKVRVALTGTGNLDAEVIDLLRAVHRETL